MKAKLLSLLYIITSFTSAQTIEFDNSGNDYIEYQNGNLPIIISAPHGGTMNSSILPNRSCGTNEPDDNTAILVQAIQDEIFALTGGYAHVIINRLHRRELDPNRAYIEATCSTNKNFEDSNQALYYWKAYHDFIDEASATVTSNWGKGLYIDLHGQSHTTPRIEIGYRISRSDINDASNDHLNTVSGSSLTNLANNNINSYSLEDLVRGTNSLGALFHRANYNPYSGSGSTANTSAHYAYLDYPGCNRNNTFGYRATPSDYNFGGGSCNDQRPNNSNYFSGFYYSNERHGSANIDVDVLNKVGNSYIVQQVSAAGTVDGIMTEVNRRVRDVGSTLEPFAKDYANVVLEFINLHYNDFAGFSYSQSIYDISDLDESPTLTTGVTGGIYISSPLGLSINQNTGEIDFSESTPGDYTITYSVGPTSPITLPHRYYSSNQSITVEDNSLGINNYTINSVEVKPNPTKSVVNFTANTMISYINLYNILGQKIKTFKVYHSEGILDIKNLTDGLYILKFKSSDSNQIMTKRIIKN
ncbi:T9SS type A sorting domain-containing protein [uncultured Winogradskyella sp.]|uniref:T9SS type A sorting domain-containing protein n=1 Tax=uncultured Winogradskyella sp. TaxID=395353 RepID=UPI002638BDAB|nr:T9SS type A sorting domain-containing protein [uncultured Winogradskyella sp.]